MQTVQLDEAQAPLAELVEDVAKGNEVIIARNGRALAKLVAPGPIPDQSMCKTSERVRILQLTAREESNSSESKPLACTDPLWRYMRWSAFILLLRRRELYFPSIKTLQRSEPWEAMFNHLDVHFDDLREKRSQGEREGLNEWLNPRKSQPGPSDSEIVFAELIKRRAASCWYRQIFESALMWKGYGEQGVVVKTTVGKLKKFLESSEGQSHFLISPVRYRFANEAGVVNFDGEEDLVLRPFLVKRHEFSQECEVRVLTECEPELDGRTVIGQTGGNLFDIIDEVFISPTLPQSEANAFEEMIKGVIQNSGAQITGPNDNASPPTQPMSMIEQHAKQAASGVQVRHSALRVNKLEPKENESFAQGLEKARRTDGAVSGNSFESSLPWPLREL